MKKSFAIFYLLLVAFLFSACSMLKSLQSVIALKDCSYSYNSISNVQVGGISANDGVSLVTLTKVMTLLGNASSSIPVCMDVNVDVGNPNTVDAGFEKVSYRLFLDSIDITEGEILEPFKVEAGGKSILPVNIQVDLRKIITNQNGNSVLNLAKNLLGISTAETSKLKLCVKPTIRLGEKNTITTPSYIPIKFEVGGDK